MGNSYFDYQQEFKSLIFKMIHKLKEWDYNKYHSDDHIKLLLSLWSAVDKFNKDELDHFCKIFTGEMSKRLIDRG